MDKRKVVYVCDVNNTTEFMTSRPVRALLDPLWEKYNVDFVTVQDQENLGMSFTQCREIRKDRSRVVYAAAEGTGCHFRRRGHPDELRARAEDVPRRGKAV